MSQLERAAKVVQEQAIETGFASGAQLAYWAADEKAARSISMGSDGNGDAVEIESMTASYCLLKPILTMVYGLLVDQGAVHWNSPLASYIECSEPVGACTIEDLLTHRVSLQAELDHESGVGRRPSLSEILTSRVASAGPRYSEFVNWLLLATVASELVGEPVENFVTREILSKLAIDDIHIGHWGDDSSGRLRVNGAMLSPNTFIPMLAERSGLFDWSVNPGYGGYSSARAAANLMAEILRSANGHGMISSQAARQILTPDEVRFDTVLRRNCQFGCGIFTNCEWFDLKGIVSPSSFGQFGLMGVSAVVAEPSTSEVVSYSLFSVSDADTMNSWLRPAILGALLS